jgi:hypothetical protein
MPHEEKHGENVSHLQRMLVGLQGEVDGRHVDDHPHLHIRSITQERAAQTEDAWCVAGRQCTSDCSHPRRPISGTFTGASSMITV